MANTAHKPTSAVTNSTRLDGVAIGTMTTTTITNRVARGGPFLSTRNETAWLALTPPLSLPAITLRLAGVDGICKCLVDLRKVLDGE